MDRKKIVTLYHGTCEESAKSLISNGWKPKGNVSEGNLGDPKYLYLTTHPLDAEWFSNEKGCNIVLSVNVPISNLHVDPDDGIYSFEYWSAIKENNEKLAKEYFKKEINTSKNIPAKFVAYKPIEAEKFKMCKKIDEKWI